MPKVIHAASILKEKEGARYLLLRQSSDQHYCWYELSQEGEESAPLLSAPSVEEALRLARSHWKRHYFKMVNCGFRYTLPERDEHGLNALFHQMATSYSSSNGIYFDSDLGNNCFVNFASDEARNLLKFLKKVNKL